MIIDDAARETERATKIEKLPKWVQHYISKLEADVTYHKGRQDLADAGDTDTRIQNYSDGDTYLPNGTTIRFSVGDGDWVDCTVTGKVLEVYGNRTLGVEPRSSNHIILTQEKR